MGLISKNIFARQLVSMCDLDKSVFVVPETHDRNIARIQVGKPSIHIV